MTPRIENEARIDVFVVVGQTGEYSDRSEWFVAAYSRRDLADCHALAAEEVARGIYADAELSDDPWQFRRDATNPYDTSMDMDYTGTSYYVAPVPLFDALPEVA